MHIFEVPLLCLVAGDGLWRCHISQVSLGVIWAGSKLSKEQRACSKLPHLQELSRKKKKSKIRRKYNLFMFLIFYFLWMSFWSIQNRGKESSVFACSFFSVHIFPLISCWGHSTLFRTPLITWCSCTAPLCRWQWFSGIAKAKKGGICPPIEGNMGSLLEHMWKNRTLLSLAFQQSWSCSNFAAWTQCGFGNSAKPIPSAHRRRWNWSTKLQSIIQDNLESFAILFSENLLLYCTGVVNFLWKPRKLPSKDDKARSVHLGFLFNSLWNM